jgi:IclR family transcriptional regulator, acetate operon repressor
MVRLVEANAVSAYRRRHGASMSAQDRIVAFMARRPAQRNSNGHPAGSVENALRTFQLLRDRRSIRVAELAVELGVARSTAHRLLALLSAYGAVEQEPGTPTYRPGPLLGQLGLSTLRQRDLVRLIHPYLERLSDEVGETAHFSVLQGCESVFLDSVECRRQTLRVTSRVGLTYPAHATSGGKALLARMSDDAVRELFARHGLDKCTDRTVVTVEALLRELEEVRINGYATNWGESEIGVAAVAVVLHNSRGDAVGALAVSAPEQRLPPSRLSYLARKLREASDEIGTLIA